MKELINECSIGLTKSISTISNNIEQASFSFNTSELIQYTAKGCESSCPVWVRLGYRLKEYRSPILYWFEIVSEVDVDKILSHLILFKNNQIIGNPNFRAIPALKKRIENNHSKILYVGCCRTTKLIDRMFWHFGYYNIGRTQGLQLCHWAQEFNLDIKLHVMIFPAEARLLIEVYEKYLAGKLKPIVGIH